MIDRAARRIAIACLPGLGAALAAQDPVSRENAIGVVRGLDAGQVATVELVSRPWPAQSDLGDIDIVQVRTDERGRFRAGLLPGRAYSAWACFDAGEAGRCGSTVQHGLVARDVVVLDFGEKPVQKLAHLSVDVPAGWPLPIHVSAVTRSQARLAQPFVFDLQPEGNGDYAVPPFPRETLTLVVTAESGAQIAEFEITDTQLLERSMAIKLPEPKLRRLAVRDIDTGKGVAGATVYARSLTRDAPLVPIATTDADGCAEVTAVEAARLIARDPLHAPAALQPAANAGGEADWTPLREGFVPDFVAHVGAGIALKGRLLVGDHPAPDSTLLLSEGAMHYQQKNSRSLEWMRRVLDLDVEGRFVAKGVLAEFPPDLVVLLGRKTMAALPATWRNAWPVVTAPVAVDAGQRQDLDFGDIDLAALVPIRIQVETADGAPVLDARLSLLLRRSVFARTDLPEAPVDRSGACILLVPKESQFGLLAECATGMMAGTLATGVRKGLEPVPVVVRVKPMVAVEGRVIDPKGQPIEGARVWTQLQSQLRGGLRTARAKPDEAPANHEGAIFVPSLEGMRDDQIMTSRFNTSARTDATGHFVLMVPDIGVALTVCANRVQVPLSPDDWPPKPIEIELPSK